MMKLLFVCFYPLPHPGGIWTFVSQLNNRLQAMGHQVDILALNPETSTYYFLNRETGATLVNYRPEVIQQLEKTCTELRSNSWLFSTEVSRHVLELTALSSNLEQYDLVYAQDAISAYAIGSVKPPNTPLVMSTHGYLLGEILHYLKNHPYPGHSEEELKRSREYKYFQALEQQGYDSCDYIHTQSVWMRHILQEHSSIPTGKMITFPYGIDTSRFHTRSRTVVGLDRVKKSNKKVILFAGRLEYLKGIHDLVDALAGLKRLRNDWVCWIAGDGDSREALRLQCEMLNLSDEVCLLGLSDDVPSLMQNADFFVLPGYQDTQPHAVMEAQLVGLPVIVSDAAGLPEMVVHGENGFIVPTRDRKKLTEYMNILLKDDHLRKSFSKNALSWAHQNWSLDRMVENFLAFFDLAIQKYK